jgi:hypothetical protein
VWDHHFTWCIGRKYMCVRRFDCHGGSILKDRRGDQRGGEWEPIKIPPWNLAYIPKLPQIHSTKSRRATSQNLNHNSTSLSSSLAQQKHELEQVSSSKKFHSSSVDSTKQKGYSSPLHTSKLKVENPTETAARPQWKMNQRRCSWTKNWRLNPGTA